MQRNTQMTKKYSDMIVKTKWQVLAICGESTQAVVLYYTQRNTHKPLIQQSIE